MVFVEEREAQLDAAVELDIAVEDASSRPAHIRGGGELALGRLGHVERNDGVAVSGVRRRPPVGIDRPRPTAAGPGPPAGEVAAFEVPVSRRPVGDRSARRCAVGVCSAVRGERQRNRNRGDSEARDQAAVGARRLVVDRCGGWLGAADGPTSRRETGETLHGDPLRRRCFPVSALSAGGGGGGAPRGPPPPPPPPPPPAPRRPRGGGGSAPPPPPR